jgi:hypothetical protein
MTKYFKITHENRSYIIQDIFETELQIAVLDNSQSSIRIIIDVSKNISILEDLDPEDENMYKIILKYLITSYTSINEIVINNFTIGISILRGESNFYEKYLSAKPDKNTIELIKLVNERREILDKIDIPVSILLENIFPIIEKVYENFPLKKYKIKKHILNNLWIIQNKDVKKYNIKYKIEELKNRRILYFENNRFIIYSRLSPLISRQIFDRDH